MPGRNVTICAGVSGSGKSTLALRYLVNAPLSARFLFDPDPGEFNPQLGEFADRLGLDPARDLWELSLALCRGWIAYDPHTMFEGQLQEAFKWFCDYAWEKSAAIPGEKVLVVDEAWAYQTSQSIPDELQRIVQSGRKRNLHLMVLTQEPNRFNSSILNGVSEFICFKLQSRPALDLVEKYFGFDGEEVSNLQDLQFVARNCDSGGELRGKIKL
jgi:hypothetical protein